MYYGRTADREKLEELLPRLQEEFPSLELIDIYFGGQETPLVLSIE